MGKPGNTRMNGRPSLLKVVRLAYATVQRQTKDVYIKKWIISWDFPNFEAMPDVKMDISTAKLRGSSAPARKRARMGPRWQTLLLHPVVQNLGIWLLALLPVVVTGASETQSRELTRILLTHILPACLYFALPIYIHGLLLVPLLYQRRYGLYLLLLSVNVLLWSVVGFYLGKEWLPIRGYNLLFHTTMVGGIVFFGAVIKIAKDAILRNHQNRQAELRLLREQLNPHFLFNTLNNLYGLAVQKSDQLPPLMLKLSDLLRYSLYETRDGAVPLSHELEYIRNYISLESIRLADRAEIDTSIEDPAGDCRIAPLLLIVLVENCFKHLDAEPGQTPFVRVSIGMQEGTLHFQSLNSKRSDSPAPGARQGGIGLENVRKRLQMLYPNRHQLEVIDREDCFDVTLKIKPSLTNFVVPGRSGIMRP